ncbi:MAG: 1-acyl-sn-glycerol-3-phosphate acyltransferase [Xanthomonadaceae bacterium]|nr:1-acyl-sn-glycerol-3-phosphate acyltransferase [Xanthomonadaceae bacterium]
MQSTQAPPIGPFQPWRYVYRLPALLLLCVPGLPILLLTLMPGIRDWPLAGQPLGRRAQRRYGRIMVTVLGMRLRLIGSLPKPPYLVVANHISWFDIPLLHAAEPMWLVAKDGIRSWPLIGAVARMVGTIFIERGCESSRRRAGRRMAALLRRGKVVGVFPEAGISTTRGVGKFHARLMGPAVRCEVAIVPVAIRYWRDGDIHAERVFGPGTSFLGLLFSMLARPGCEGQIIVGQPIVATDGRRSELARRAQVQVTELYGHAAAC